MDAFQKVNSSWNVPPPRVLLTATTTWALAARLAVALAGYGARVAALCPRGHPVRVLPYARHRYLPRAPLRSLEEAIAAEHPDIVVPCDDRAARHLRELYAARPALSALIERSLGDPAHYDMAERRATVLGLAAVAGLPVPPTAAVRNEADLRGFAARQPFPWVLKLDASWGGRGVMIADDLPEAIAARRSLEQGLGLRLAAKSLLVNRDSFPLSEWRPRRRPRISVQGFVTGRPANCLTFCRRGEVLAQIGVEVLSTTDPTGAATVVRVIDDPDMAHTAREMARRLGLSGFCGFDFVHDQVSGRALLIEMNARATQLGHLPLGAGRDLLAALLGSLSGRTVPSMPPLPAETVALFPGAMRQVPPSPHLALAHHDVPSDQPALLRELERTPWENRSLASRLNGWWNGTGLKAGQPAGRSRRRAAGVAVS